MSCDAGKKVLYVDNDNLVEFGPVEDENGNYINDNTTFLMTLKDSEGANVSSAVDIPVDYIDDSLSGGHGDSDGRYRGRLESTVPLVEGEEYTLVITGDASGDDEFELQINCIALKRTG